MQKNIMIFKNQTFLSSYEELAKGTNVSEFCDMYLSLSFEFYSFSLISFYCLIFF